MYIHIPVGIPFVPFGSYMILEVTQSYFLKESTSMINLTDDEEWTIKFIDQDLKEYILNATRKCLEQHNIRIIGF